MVDYEVREPITNPEDALKPDAPKLHKKGNLLSKSEINRGNVEEALEEFGSRRDAHVSNSIHRAHVP